MRGMYSMYCAAAAAMFIPACATAPGGQTTQPGASYQQEFADDARDYRSEAYALWEMARRRQTEAEVLSKELGPNHERVQQRLELARELQRAANEADQKARSARRQVPHNMVQ
ncbi:hypothetical protein [Nitrospira sp. Nam74]